MSRFSAGVAALLAISTLVGWIVDINLLRAVFASAIPMAVSTALAMLTAAAGIILMTTARWTRWVARSVASVLLTIGLLTFLDHMIRGTRLFGPGHLLVRVAVFVNRLPGEMAPNTAFNCVLVGFAFLLSTPSSSSRHHRIRDCLLLVAAMIALVAFVGYLYGVPSFYHLGTYIPMAANTAVGQLALCVGFFAARPSEGSMSVIARSGAAGYLTRRAILAAFIVPLLVGYFVERGNVLHVYTTAFALSLYTAVTSLLLTVLTFFSATRLVSEETGRLRVERTLRRSNQSFRDVVEVSTEGILSIDARSRIEFVSARGAQIFGYDERELRAIEVARLFVLPEGESSESFLARLARHEVPDEQLAGRRRDGSVFPLQVSLTSRETDKGMSFTAALRDVSERRGRERASDDLQEQLDRARRVGSLGQLSATMAHEFNNVLMGIQPFVELLDRAESAAHRDMALQYIRESLRRGKQICDEVLDFSRPGALDLEPIQLAGWLEHFAEQAQRVLTPKIVVRLELPPSSTCVNADSNRLSQVLLNILFNAAHAMPNGGTLTIGAKVHGQGETFPFGTVDRVHEFAHLFIRDTGTGIKPEVLERIFEPMFTTKSHGSGLGLAVARNVITRHGGSIFAESEPGKGAVFHLFLPIVSVAAQPADRRF